MEKIIMQCLQDKTMSMFSKEWYLETSKYISDKINPDNDNVKGYVYIIKSYKTDEIKIGRTKSLQKRLIDIKAYIGDILIVGLIESYKYGSIEKDLHERFKDNRVRGEWFVFDDLTDLYSDIKKYNGFIINKKFNNISNVLSDEFINHSEDLSMPMDLKQYFSDIGLHKEGRHVKMDIYKNIPFKHPYSARKITMYMRDYIKNRGMRFTEGKSGNDRYFTVFF